MSGRELRDGGERSGELRPRDPALAGLPRPEALGRLVGGRVARTIRGVEALRDRNFRLLFAGRAISYFGTYLAPIAVAFAILDLGGSATESASPSQPGRSPRSRRSRSEA